MVIDLRPKAAEDMKSSRLCTFRIKRPAALFTLDLRIDCLVSFLPPMFRYSWILLHPFAVRINLGKA